MLERAIRISMFPIRDDDDERREKVCVDIPRNHLERNREDREREILINFDETRRVLCAALLDIIKCAEQ